MSDSDTAALSSSPGGGHTHDRRLFALSDPHLSFLRPKPMDVFGSNWTDHADRIAENWKRDVGENDIVLVPGDVSWAMRLSEARPDLEWLAALPGRKVLIRGNHDYWWSSLKKMRDLELPGFHFIQNDHVLLDGIGIGGTRLWDFPGIHWGFVPNEEREDLPDAPAIKGQRSEDPEKIRTRELERLGASLGSIPEGCRFRVAMLHFPPIGEDGAPTPITDLIDRFSIDLCVFGHIHGKTDRTRPGEDIVIGKTRYVLTSCDHLDFKPLLLGCF